jgi:CHRD domain-containing protein
LTRRLALPILAALALAIAVAIPALASVTNYRAHLAGTEGIQTLGEGQAVFQLNDDGTAITYRLNVANIDNVTMAHIHLKPSGKVVVWLYPSAPPSQLIPGRSDGTLMTGTITAADLKDPLAGMPLSALVAQIDEGNTYVNVHTTAYPAGEIRGDIH